MTPQTPTKLIVHSSGPSSQPDALVENRDYIEGLPIDGITVNVGASWKAMSPGVVLTDQEVTWWVDDMKSFNTGSDKDNYLLIVFDDPGDLFDDEAWNIAIDNVGRVAEGAEEAGFEGIILDNEEYFGAWQNFPEEHPDADPDDLEAYQDQASLRGRQMMETIEESFPTSDVGVMHGPYLSTDNGDQLEAAIRQAGGPEKHELRGPFFTGLAEGKGEEQTLIDMGELYQLRSDEDFAQSQSYRSEILPERIDWNVKEGLLAAWDEEIVQSHMVYTEEFPTGSIQTPQTLGPTLENALSQSEEVAFLYTDWGTRDLLRPGAVSEDWLDAIEDGRAGDQADAAGSPSPIEPGDLRAFLFDASNDQQVAKNTNGARIDLDGLDPHDLSIVVETDDPDVDSIRLVLGDRTQVESHEPHALFGDAGTTLEGPRDITGGELGFGDIKLELSAFDENGAQGVMLSETTFGFELL
ncbi:MAG: hypothetical protein AAF913_00015 [Pseudomonadota bacterium]